MEIEEEFLENGRLPHWARIHGVTAEIDRYKENSGRLTCQQRVSASSEDVVTKQTTISWNLSECVMIGQDLD